MKAVGKEVTIIMIEDDDCKLSAINAGSATPDHMAYQYKYDTIHGIAKGTVYLSFASKDDILLLLVCRGLDRMIAMFDEAAAFMYMQLGLTELELYREE